MYYYMIPCAGEILCLLFKNELAGDVSRKQLSVFGGFGGGDVDEALRLWGSSLCCLVLLQQSIAQNTKV